MWEMKFNKTGITLCLIFLFSFLCTKQFFKVSVCARSLFLKLLIKEFISFKLFSVYKENCRRKFNPSEKCLLKVNSKRYKSNACDVSCCNVFIADFEQVVV